MTPWYKSRALWTAVLDAFYTIALYFLAQYKPDYKELFTVLWAALQPVAALLIVKFTTNDLAEQVRTLFAHYFSTLKK